MVALSVNAVPNPLKYSLGTACLALALVQMRHAPRLVLAALEHPLLMRVGLWSYSLYLWQQPFSRYDGSALEKSGLLCLAVLAALASFYLVEQPARRALNRLADRRTRTLSVDNPG